jgi:RNA polymerase sigma-70 factor (TIGR02943 family)
MTHLLTRTPDSAFPADSQIAGGELLDRALGALTEVDPRQLEQHRSLLTRYARWLLHDRDAAEDAVQETMLAALHAPRSFGGRSSVRTWLFGILRHKVMDAFRRQAREVPLADDGEEVDGESLWHGDDDGNRRLAPSHWGDPEQALQEKRFFAVLERCIDRLPKNTARVFTMREIPGMETGEICHAVGITRDYCFVILHRARAALRDLLEREWPARASARGR